jgi:hypothetical protein
VPDRGPGYLHLPFPSYERTECGEV